MAEREGLFKRLGQGFDRYIGGLLGEDLSKMTPEERALARRQAIGAIGQGMINPANAQPAMANVMQMRVAQRERGELERRQKAAEEEMTRISARLFGGVAPTGQMIEGLEPGEAPTPVTSYYRQDPTDALRRMYGTQAGRDVAQIAPDLAKLAQEGVTGRTVGASVYNPLTGQFRNSVAEKARTLTKEEIAKEGLPPGTVAQYDKNNEIKIVYEPKVAGMGGAKDPQDLRKEVNTQLKPYTEIGDMWAKVRQAGANPTAANDLALIFGYMKILDPGSVVREGEFANAQNSAGVPDRIRGIYNSIINGQRLSPVQRQDFLRSAYGAVQSQVPRVQSVISYYTDVANALGVNPNAIIRNPLQGAMVPKVTNDSDYEKLPIGTLFEDPNGNLRTKPRNK